MAIGSQASTVQAITDIPGLAHEIFAQGIEWNILAVSPTAQLFNRAQRNQDYKVLGEKLVGAAQLSYSNGAMASTNRLPDHQYVDPKNWETTPVRRYRRIAKDLFIAARATDGGAFADLTGHIFDQLWDSWGRMEIRHAVGDSRGYLCLVDARISATVWSAKDGYGHVGTNPFLHLEAGSIIAWLDASGGLTADGADKIASINYTNRQVTMTSAASWEPADTTASGDPIVMATTFPITKDYFATESGNAPHGVMGIVDPDSNFSTVLGIAEASNARWKPLKQASVTFDQFEVAEHWRALRAYSTSGVGPGSHVAICQAAVSSELARSLGPYQQQQQMGRTFEGGYTAVRMAVPGAGQMEFVEDDYFLHNVLVTLCTECLYRDSLNGEADFYTDDGSQWSRIQDTDADEAYVRQYMQTWSDRRNRHGALTGIALPDVNADNFAGGVPRP